jgi:hypothetical protein
VAALVVAVTVGGAAAASVILLGSGDHTGGLATAGSTAAPGSAGPVTALSRVYWRLVAFPQRCAPYGFEIQQHAVLRLPGGAVALVLVRCATGAGTAPSGLYAFRVTSGGAPVLVQTLLGVRYPAYQHYVDNFQADSFVVSGKRVRLTVHGFSARSVPDCCPDVVRTLRWVWTGSRFRAS